MNVTCEHVVQLGRNAVPITRPACVEVAATPTVRSASAEQVDAFPRLQNSFNWRQTAAAYVQGNTAVGVAAAVATGLVLGEVARALYAHALAVV